MKTKESVIYYPGTESKPVQPENGKFFTLEELQEIVGGYIEMLYLDDDRVMVVNEEGKLIGLPENQSAAKIISSIGVIVGTALVCPSKLIK